MTPVVLPGPEPDQPAARSLVSVQQLEVIRIAGTTPPTAGRSRSRECWGRCQLRGRQAEGKATRIAPRSVNSQELSKKELHAPITNISNV